MFSPKILLIAHALILTGCVSLAPEYQRPKSNVPEQLHSDLTVPLAEQGNRHFLYLAGKRLFKTRK